MKKLLFLTGIGVGFVLGARAGRSAYDQIAATARTITGQPAVRQVVDQVSDAVKDQAGAVKGKVADKLPSSSANGSSGSQPAHAAN